MKICTGNILTNTAGIIVHGVNCQRTMGSGMALQIKNMYPAVYNSYLKCFGNEPDQYVQSKFQYRHNLLGSVDIVNVTDNFTIINAFTQERYGSDPNVRYVSYDAVDSAFKDIANYYSKPEISKSEPVIRFPLIGAGRGNGNWNVIREIILANIEGVVDPDKIELWVPSEAFT